jgi:hypothetical protein
MSQNALNLFVQFSVSGGQSTDTRMQNLCLSGMAVTTEEEAKRVDTPVHIHLTDVSHRHTGLFTSQLT